MTDAERLLRRAMQSAAAATFVGALLELALVDHVDGWRQWMAFAFAGLGLVALVWAWRDPRRPVLRAVRAVSVVVAVGALSGIVLHGVGNAEFEREVKPNASTAEVAWGGLTGGNPFFAPGMLALAAALTAAATLRHPALDGARRSA